MSPGARWIAIVVGLLALSVGIQGVMLFKALDDPSFAVEPDYERKAAEWDAIQRQRAASARLGWEVDLRTAPGAEAGSVDVELTVRDREGAPLSGATVTLDAFHNARAADIHSDRLPEGNRGVYTKTMPLRRSGIWEFRLRVARGSDVFTRVVRKSVLSVPRALAGGGAVIFTLVTTVFLASLVGSLHCAGMCGVFVTFAVHPGRERRGSGGSLQAAYHLGRLTTYVAFGALAGQAGAALDLGGAFFGIQRAALLVAGAAMIAFGVVALLRLAGVRLPPMRRPERAQRAYVRALGALEGRSPVLRALGTGLLSTLLPCGWLYAFVLTAAGTGTAVVGAVTMVAFWAGTLPVLGAIGIGARRLAGPLRRYVPAVTALALVAVGLMAVAGRFSVPAVAADPTLPASGGTIESAIARVSEVADEPPSCHANGE